jgi:hypothetical protein
MEHMAMIINYILHPLICKKKHSAEPMPAAAWKPSVPVLELWQSQKMGLRQVVKYHICVKFSMEGCQNK